MSELTVGITGPRGFIAGHLAARLQTDAEIRVVLCPRETWDDPAALQQFVMQCDAIVHLAGMNRGEDDEIHATNTALVRRLVRAMESAKATPHVLFASSTQRGRDNAYGRSKKHGEQMLSQWAQSAAAQLTVLLVPNVYGAGCRPFYNSVVATFCHQLTHGEKPAVLLDQEVEFVWVNDLIEQIARAFTAPCHEQVQSLPVGKTSRLKITRLLSILDGFRRDYFERDVVPDLSDSLQASLYATFLSYVDLSDHRHTPPLRTDDRGNLFEIIKLANGGQMFFSSTKPGVIRGNHYHTRKVEWFCVVKGEAVIRIRRLGSGDVHEFRVSGDSPEFISIPVFHTHSIENVGDGELLTMFWCNEIFDAENPDTFFEKVA